MNGTEFLPWTCLFREKISTSDRSFKIELGLFLVLLSSFLLPVVSSKLSCAVAITQGSGLWARQSKLFIRTQSDALWAGDKLSVCINVRVVVSGWLLTLGFGLVEFWGSFPEGCISF